MPLRILDSDHSRIHAQNAPGGVAELKDVPRHALDRKILVHRADEGFARFDDNTIIGIVRNRAAGSQRDETRAAPAAHAMMDRIMMHQGRAPAAFCAESLGQHPQHFIELFAGQISVGIRRAHQVEKILFIPVFTGDGGDQLLGEHIDRLLRGRKPDALQRVLLQRFQSFHAQGEMRPAPVRDHRVDFIHNQRAHRGEHFATRRRCQQQVKRFRCGDKNVRRFFGDRLAFRGRRVARAHFGANMDIAALARLEGLADSRKWFEEIFVDVIAQRLEGRHIEHSRFVRQRPGQPLPEQGIERTQESRESFSRARGCRDERVAAGLNRGPTLLVRTGRRSELLFEPPRNDGMKLKPLHSMPPYSEWARTESIKASSHR